MTESDRPSFDEARRLLREQVAVAELSADSYARLHARASGARRVAVQRRRVVAFAATGAAVVLAIGLWLRSDAPVCGFAIAGGDVRCLPDATLVVGDGTATLRLPQRGTRIVAQQQTRLAREGDGVRIAAGRATFTVAPGENEPAVRVLVSHGVLEVLGTLFRVEQEASGGRVLLERGRLRFVSTSGNVRPVEPGVWLSWPIVAPAPPEEPDPVAEPAPRKSAEEKGKKKKKRKPSPLPLSSGESKPKEPAAVLTELQTLRIRHEYDALIARLEQILEMERREPLRERLSYELCDTIAHHSKAPGGACACLTEHQKRYPRGEYGKQISDLRGELSCP